MTRFDSNRPEARRVGVLYVGSDPDREDRLRSELDRITRSNGTLTAVGSAADALEALDGRVDCVLSGYDLPDGDGLSLLERVRKRRPGLPFVLTTDRPPGAVADEAVHAGVTDYHHEGDGIALLCNRIANAVSRYHAERRAARSERVRVGSGEMVEALVDAFPDYAFLYDEDGRYLDVLLGRTESRGRTRGAEDLVGRTVHDVFPAETAEEIHDAVRSALDAGEIRAVEYDVETVGGRRWYEGRVAPLADAEHDRAVAVLAARDITRKRELREELRRQNERLREFSSVIAHDLRNPLNVASGRLELARGEDAPRHLDHAEDALARAERLIDDLLTLARDGETVEDAEPVSIGDLAETSWRTVHTAEATLRVEGDPEVRGDPDRLRHLFENLFRNAVEHGGPDTTVTVGPHDGGFFVADDGPGIPPADRDAVFELGYSTGDGTGLGLRIVRRMVEAHGGTVRVTTSADGGARFEAEGLAAGE